MQIIRRIANEVCQRVIESRAGSLNAARIEMENLSNISFAAKIISTLKKD